MNTRDHHQAHADDRQALDAGPARHGAPSRVALQLDQVAGELGERHLPARDHAHDLAAVEHHEPVGELVDVGEVVLDVDAGAAGLLDPAHEVEDLLDLLERQRHGRLVEDDQVGVEIHRAADRDALALAAGEVAHGRIGVDAGAAKADLLAQQAVGDRLLALDVDEAEAGW